MSHPKRGRVTLRWKRSERDYTVAWGPGPGRLKGPAGGLLALVIGGGSLFRSDGLDVTEEFCRELRRMGFDPDTFRAQVDVLKQEAPPERDANKCDRPARAGHGGVGG